MLTHPIYAHYYKARSTGRFVLRLSSSFDLSIASVNNLIFDITSKKQANKIVKEYEAIKWNF
jgi:hypothetical protein